MARSASAERVNFAGGELSPSAAARADFGRYQISVEKCENMIVMAEGGLTRAPGTRFVLELKDQTQKSKHITFRFSTDDYYTLIINGGYARIVRAGGFIQNPDTSPHEFVVPWIESQLPTLRAVREDNVLTVVSSIEPQRITRAGHTSWSVAAFRPDNGPVQDQNLDVAITIQASAATGAINLTGVGTSFAAAQIGGVFRLHDRDLSLTPQWRAGETAIALNAVRRYNGRVYQAMVAGVDAGVNPPEHDEGDVSAGNGLQTWRFLHEDHGFVRITAVTDTLHAAGTVLKRLPTTVTTGATYRWSAPAWTSDLGFPSAICFISPRLALFRKSQMWISGEQSTIDFDAGEALDDEAINRKIKSPDTSLVDIQWALPSGVLLLGTVDLEWSVRGVNVFDPLTPTNPRAIPETSDGSAAIEPVLVDGGPMFVGKTRKRLHHAKYSRQEQQIGSVELSRFARHIFRSRLAGTAWQRDPHRVLWLWFDNGTMASMTYVPTEEIIAFCRHPMVNAFVEEMSCVPSTTSGTDEVTLTVRRTIQGQTKRYIEQLAPYFEPLDPDAPTAEGAWFVDSGLRITGAQMTTITQLVHLAGQEIAVVADGAMQARKTVSAAGAITLDFPADDVIVGLPREIYGRDLPRNFQAAGGGSTRGQMKTAHEALIQVHETAGLQVRVYDGEIAVNGLTDPNDWEEVIETGGADYGEPVPLKTASFKPNVEGAIAMEAQLEWRATHALPVTILGLSPKIAVEEG